MRTVRTIAELRGAVRGWREAGRSVGLVPTMGALHDGHLALVRASRAACDRTVATIFVNPTQFSPREDFATYPRDEARDHELLTALGADLLFAPELEEMYPPGATTVVSVPDLNQGLCAATRPHFFDGVATVVAKLLLQAAPDVAFFGEKDYQQLQVIRRMVRDLHIPVRIAGVPTLREASGLAMSSRNAYLTADERAIAPTLYRLLLEAGGAIATGAPVAGALAGVDERLLAAGFRAVDYVAYCDAESLQPLERHGGAPGRLLAAAWLGKARLIDNLEVLAPRSSDTVDG